MRSRSRNVAAAIRLPRAQPRASAQKIENWRTRVRHHDFGDLDQALFEFYARHLANVSSLHELNRLLRDGSQSSLLCVTEADLAGGGRS